jgi:FdhD protein
MDPIVAFEVGPGAAGLRPVPQAPCLSAATCEALREVQVVDEAGAQRTIHIPTERALTVVIDGHELVTLMTLGAAPELMVLGFLINQRLVENAAAVESITVDWHSAIAKVKTRPRARGARGEVHQVAGDRQVAEIHRAAATGSGQGSVFTDLMSEVDSIALPPVEDSRIDSPTLLQVLETMRHHDVIHRKAGSVHSCALFRGPELMVCVEDVGRHNGLDTIGGWMAVHGVAGGDKILFTTGRLTSEMVMKTALSGIAIAVSRNGVSAMGYDLATTLGMTLFGRAANRRFLCYTGIERFDARRDPSM